MFYGWSDKDASSVVKTILGSSYVAYIDSKKSNIKKITEALDSKKLGIKCGIIKGIGSKSDYQFYVYLDTAKESVSGSDDDICMEQFTIKEIKNLIKKSFELKQQYPSINQPSLINLVIADPK